MAEALAQAWDPDPPLALAAQVLVVRALTQTSTGRYLGVAYLQRLLREPPGEELGACIDTDLDCIGPEVPTRRVAEYLATYDPLAAPVCDGQGRLLGAVSIDDVLDHLPETWRRTVESPGEGPATAGTPLVAGGAPAAGPAPAPAALRPGCVRASRRRSPGSSAPAATWCSRRRW